MTIERVDAPLSGSEWETLRGFHNYHRQTFLTKIDGLSKDQLGATLPPSDLTLGGMAKHLAFVENYWFTYVFAGREAGEPWASADWDADPDWDWHSAAHDSSDDLLRLLAQEQAGADAVVDAAGSLEQLSTRVGRRKGEQFSLRWILVHLIEEYARHNGHADLIRQSIDGLTGE